MTLKDKKNKREYNRKQKAEGGPQASNNEKATANKKKDKPASNFSGGTESADKLISEANKKFEEAESIQV